MPWVEIDSVWQLRNDKFLANRPANLLMLR